MNRKHNTNREPDNEWIYTLKKTYWIMNVIFIVFSLSAFPFAMDDGEEVLRSYIEKTVIIQTVILVIIMMFGEFIFRMKSRMRDYLIIGMGVGISITIFSLTPTDVYGTQVIMILPTLISILFFNYRKVIFASALTLFIYLILIYILPSYQAGIPVQQISLVIGSIVVSAFLALGIVGRGLDIMKAEEQIIVEEKNLTIQKLSMAQLVRKDALTGLNNHRTFQERLRYLEEHRAEGAFVHLAIIDIDNFKKVNDSFGHWAGDIVLRKLGKLIHDLASEDLFVARYGGEEFAILFTRVDRDAVQEWLMSLYNALYGLIFSEVGGLKVTISTGCHQWRPTESKEVLFQRTDEALYAAKSMGKNQVVWTE